MPARIFGATQLKNEFRIKPQSEVRTPESLKEKLLK